MAIIPTYRIIPSEEFAMICFIALMQSGKGIESKSPDYIKEKTWLLKSGESSFGALDIYNMRIVVQYCDTWGIALPPKVEEEYRLQEEALADLQARGITTI